MKRGSDKRFVDWRDQRAPDFTAGDLRLRMAQCQALRKLSARRRECERSPRGLA
jgi:hypothetical protein